MSSSWKERRTVRGPNHLVLKFLRIDLHIWCCYNARNGNTSKCQRGTPEPGLTCRGKGNLQAPQSWHCFWWIYGEIAVTVPFGCPWGKGDLQFILFCFYHQSPTWATKYHTRTPVCKNKEIQMAPMKALVCWYHRRIETSQHLWEWRNIHTNTGWFRCPLIAH